jgi:hypothetical protein
MESCLNCRYQPEWGEPQQREGYTLRTGDCKYDVPKIKLPACVDSYISLIKRPITRYSDDSGVHYNCKTWEPAQDGENETN